MKLSIRAIALTAGLIWAACMLAIGAINMADPAYGGDFLRIMSSVYPGFHPVHSWLSVAIGTVYGFVDGIIVGWIFAWIYDAIARRAHPGHRVT